MTTPTPLHPHPHPLTHTPPHTRKRERPLRPPASRALPADAPPRCDLDDVATVGRLLHLNGLDRIPASDWGAAFPPDSRPLEFRNKARQLAEACGFRTLDADGMGGYSVELGDA